MEKSVKNLIKLIDNLNQFLRRFFILSVFHN